MGFENVFLLLVLLVQVHSVGTVLSLYPIPMSVLAEYVETFLLLRLRLALSSQFTNDKSQH